MILKFPKSPAPIAATLEKLRDNTIDHAYIQVPDKQDIQPLTSPKGGEIHWLITPDKLTAGFLQGLESHGENLSDTALFIAVEASVVKELKFHLNDNCQFDKSKLYASAYWNQKR